MAAVSITASITATITASILCCVAAGFMRRLLRRPNCSPGLGGALHDCKPHRPRELCVSRRAVRARPTSRGPSRGARPLLFLMWLRVSCGFDDSAGAPAQPSEVRPIRPRDSAVKSPIADPPSLPPPWPPPLPPELHRKHNFHTNATNHSAFVNGGGERPPSALWILRGPLLFLLVAVLVAFYRHYSRLTQNEANLRASRDRAHFDLNLIVHRVACEQNWTTAAPGSGAASLPPGPPSSPAASISSGPSASLPRGPPSSSAHKPTVPLSWAEADRQFYASPAGKAYLAANPVYHSPSRASRALAPSSTRTAQLRRGMNVAFGRDASSAPAPFALPPAAQLPGLPAMPHVANSATSTKKRERDTQHLLAAADNNEPPPPVHAPASLLAAASGTELVELAHAQASWICAREEDTTRGMTAPSTSAALPEFPGSALSATARPGVRLVDLMSLAELQDDQAEAALSNLLPLSHY